MSVSIGPYNVDVVNELGRGTFGTVFKGKHRNTGESVAVKKINYDTGNTVNEEMLQMANNELSILSKLKEHENIVRLTDHQNDGRNMWLIMEFCELGDLSVYLRERKALDILAKIKIMTECAAALNFMHSLRPPVIHRDIKPSNVLMKRVGDEDIVKLTDFGTGKMYEYKAGLQYKLTMGTLAGSQYFMAPEFFAADGKILKYQPSVDIFSLGLLFQVVLLYSETYPFMEPLSSDKQISGQLLPYGKDLADAIERHRPAPQLFKTECTNNRELQQVIIEMTTYNSSDRITLAHAECKLWKIYCKRLRAGYKVGSTQPHLHKATQVDITDLHSHKATQVDISGQSFNSDKATQVDISTADSVLPKSTLDLHKAYATTSRLPSQKWDRKTVMVTGIENVPDYTLEDLYENKRISGGGPVQSVTILDSNTVALVTFTSETDAADVLAQQLIKTENGSILSACKPTEAHLLQGGTESISRKVKSNSVKVLGIDRNVTADILEMLFENETRSGGGPVQNVTVEPELEYAIVTFEDINVAQRVIEKGCMEFHGISLIMEPEETEKEVDSSFNMAPRPLSESLGHSKPLRLKNISIF